MKDYVYLLVPFTSLVLAQIIKFTIESIKAKRLVWERLFNGSAGMPSSHASFSFSLTVIILFIHGLTSPLFAISLIFSFIVAYDSMGVRMESGKQAVAINTIVGEMVETNSKITIAKLKEKLGHKPLEVLMGMLLGTIVGLIYFYILF
ncbi:MAG: divergent PAP2 family protein [Firmicutes bacterium]|nr:divergent PAP2 family protein [Bacillota bacterium]